MNDSLKNIVDEGDRDIIVTLPSEKPWFEYLALFMEAQQKLSHFEIIFSTLPKTGPGKRCYITHGGLLKGWLQISKLRENEENQFIVELIPLISSPLHKIPISDIDNEFKYFLDNFSRQ